MPGPGAHAGLPALELQPRPLRRGAHVERLRVLMQHRDGYTTGLKEVQVFRTGGQRGGDRNAAPYVVVKPDPSFRRPAAARLEAVVEDDAQPSGTLESSWRLVDGPGRGAVRRRHRALHRGRHLHARADRDRRREDHVAARHGDRRSAARRRQPGAGGHAERVLHVAVGAGHGDQRRDRPAALERHPEPALGHLAAARHAVGAARLGAAGQGRLGRRLLLRRQRRRARPGVVEAAVVGRRRVRRRRRRERLRDGARRLQHGHLRTGDHHPAAAGRWSAATPRSGCWSGRRTRSRRSRSGPCTCRRSRASCPSCRRPSR